jgi:galactoside O-acetyltransferase
VQVYSRSDDFSGRHMTNPMVPAKYTGASGGPVTLKRHAIVGAGSVILPRLTLEEGVAVGALSLVTKTLDEWGIYAGNPAARIRDRKRHLLELERDLRDELGSMGKRLRPMV